MDKDAVLAKISQWGSALWIWMQDRKHMAYVFIGMVVFMILLSIMVFSGGVESPQYQTASNSHATVSSHTTTPAKAVSHDTAAAAAHDTAAAAESHTAPAVKEETTHKAAPAASSHAAPVVHSNFPKGVFFVEQAMKPMQYELDGRFWGWRPNDITRQFTDNVNEFQLGVLEATRRTTENLAKRLSRTGDTDSFDPNLELAMNQFMIGAKSLVFPSAEGAYSTGLKEMEKYKERLKKGQARFYVRSDNLIPLLKDYRDLLGSCDENLVKSHEDNGEEVSTFSADNYLYYSKGVASAVHTMLEGILVDFQETLEPRHGEELIEHAIHSLHMAKEMDPWLVTEGASDGFIANHRANMAAPISHARFYLDKLIETLST
ncbi:DUF2333 family protein [Desulfatibacillum aliphaticivorans]|uniref:DUF2333 family protein n=1 Tax=Desulfatibacillum aliphaticivorans TaxID=218208 RepID=UPI000409F80A|nr:DUF2333 family protein [Desulfatibacillum aliphaticivorans]